MLITLPKSVYINSRGELAEAAERLVWIDDAQTEPPPTETPNE